MQAAVIILEIAIIALLIAVLYSKKTKKAENRKIVLMDEGKIKISALSSAGIDVEELAQDARLAGYFNLGDIDTAVMEKTGKISFLPKPMNRRLNPKDFNFAPVREGIPVEIIKNGEIIEENLKALELDSEEVMTLILSHGRKIENILLATITDSGRVDVFEK